ncbi:glutathione S-transferase family protein [Ciceribacter sp. L1K23]|uniref:glutathione S-transferase family protein n=1 Tax=Ciceribacter sp. L1K23 TaxID=2820276 RepID=UPI001B8270C5|nr:glutathione S-transferase family protein [Ciceribacter sp. L1K23]MBR0556512.1 glutathione S-transferase family protein [Ciceribacter sp. L1K23]
MLQLHYFPDNASLAPHFLLVETGVEYSLVLVDRQSNAQKSAAYLKLNPAGRIPTLVHDDLVLFESPAICTYICELDPASRFIPPLGHQSRPLFFQWLAFLNNTLQAEYMMWRYVENHTTDPGGVQGIKAAQELRLERFLALLDQQLGKNRFLLGDTVSGCDHFLFMLAMWSEELSRPTTSFENLPRFMRDMAERPAVQQVCAIEEIGLQRYLG